MNYSGLVRSKSRCHFGGFAYKPGDVFEVTNIVLWDDDPYEAVKFDRFDEEPVAAPPWIHKVARYVRISLPVPARPAISRMAPEDQKYAGPREGLRRLP
jgi:hypothetical protein